MDTIQRFLIHNSLYLADAKSEICKGAGITGGSGGCNDKSLTAHVGNLTEALMTAAGAIAVIVIIIGGIRYITSSGDATRIKQAKDTILYAIVGLIVAILAYAIVRFVDVKL